jgi:hypothetical protein
MKATVAAAILLASAATAAAQDDVVGVRGRYWFATLNGTALSDGVGLPGTVIDIPSTLGLSDQDNSLELEGWLQIPVVGRFSVGWWRTKFEGSATLSIPFDFGGQTFQINDVVSSRLDLQVYAVTYEFVLPSIPLGELVNFQVGLLAGVRVIHADGHITLAGTPYGDSGEGVLPVIGLHGTVLFAELIRVEAQVAGLVFEYSGSAASYIEATIEVTVSLGPVFAGVGYKYVLTDVDLVQSGLRFQTHLDIDGLFLTAGVRF